ncbi:phage tail protein [Polaribacter sp.]|uniref:phage tail protein n=1 Tax=Polaribacter sp. TaxID=1920175 RepID=UPI003EF617D2
MIQETKDSLWPIPKFYFMVDWGATTNIIFQEVRGLDTNTETEANRQGNNPVFSVISMPGLKKNGKVTLKQAIFEKGTAFWDWYEKVKMNTINRENVVVKLIDEAGNVTMEWTLLNAYPVKLTATDLQSDGSEVAIESIEIAHEGFTIAKQ